MTGMTGFYLTSPLIITNIITFILFLFVIADSLIELQ